MKCLERGFAIGSSFYLTKMKSTVTVPVSTAVLVISLGIFASSATFAASTTDAWRIETKPPTGPVLQVDLPDLKGKRRAVFVAFEYARNCDPLFSYLEIVGNQIGTAKSQTVLKDSKIGIILNGTFHTWHAAITNYNNGFEVAFGVQNELALQLLTNVNSIAYVTPSGERIPLPTADFSRSFQTAIESCRKRLR